MGISPALSTTGVVLNVVGDLRVFCTIIINLLENKLTMCDVFDELVSFACGCFNNPQRDRNN